MRRDIEFKMTGQDTILRGWLYLPDDRPHKDLPCVVLAHGFTGTKEMLLDRYAEVFANAGLAALAYDHPNFGSSDGEPRAEATPHLQNAGYRDAITFAQHLDEVDAGRIGIWGTSYSGATVVQVAALDRRVKAVVCQVPVISGYWNIRRLSEEQGWTTIHDMFAQARAHEWEGGDPIRLPVVSNDPNVPAAIPGDNTHDFFMSQVEAGKATTWVNETTMRTLEAFLELEARPYYPLVSPTPLLMIAATEDTTTPIDLALEAYETAHQPKELVLIKGQHYESYVEQLDTTSGAARDFLVKHLSA